MQGILICRSTLLSGLKKKKKNAISGMFWMQPVLGRGKYRVNFQDILNVYN